MAEDDYSEERKGFLEPADFRGVREKTVKKVS